MAVYRISLSNLFPLRYFCSYYVESKFCATAKYLSTFTFIKNGQTQIFTPKLLMPVSRQLRCPYFITATYSSTRSSSKPSNLDSLVDYERVSEETLQSLYDRFEEVLQTSCFGDSDVNYSNGVLTITLEANCVYVINKQTPNRQIWLSSPISGPKRYDYVNGIWIYKHDGISLHQLLKNELSEMLQKDANFLGCAFSD